MTSQRIDHHPCQESHPPENTEFTHTTPPLVSGTSVPIQNTEQLDPVQAERERVAQKRAAAAKYMREYRARKKRQLDAPHEDVTAKRRKLTETGDIEQHTDKATVEKVIATTSTESRKSLRDRRAMAAKHSRDYRARQSSAIDTTTTVEVAPNETDQHMDTTAINYPPGNRELAHTIPPLVSATSVTIQNREQLDPVQAERERVDKKRAAAAKYMREYHARKKRQLDAPPDDVTAKRRELAETGDIAQHTDTTAIEEVRATTSTETLETSRHRRATAAKNSRDYRVRQRAAIDTPTTVQVGPNETATVPAEPNEENQEQLTQRPPIPTVTYEAFSRHAAAHAKFKEKFLENKFGAVCNICDRLWYENDLKCVPPNCTTILTAEFPHMDFEIVRVCNTCRASLQKGKIPTFSTSNGFKYPPRPDNLPELDLVTERLISPRLPFMQIRRLRHGQGQYGILGQVINVPVSVNTMVHRLPRELDDDYCINVHIKRKKIHKSSYLIGLVQKRVVKAWLRYLVDTPLYKFYDITIDKSFFSANTPPPHSTEDLSEEIGIEECLHAQQQTLYWNEDKYLRIAPGENQVPRSVLFDEHCEELAFPSIYFGQFRSFKEGLTVTQYMIATSELRRADRRGVTPQHLLYMAMKILRLRTRDALTVAFKFIGKDTRLTRAQIESSDFVDGCLETNLAFLRSIPNSIYYWSQRKRDLFAMIRQLGKPTFFLTMSANEIGWPKLMKILYKLRNNGAEIDSTDLANMHYNLKASLVNEDPVTCAIHFNKLVQVIIGILQSKLFSPFGKHFVQHYFKRIEFQHRGSPHAHILLWLNESPVDALGEDKAAAETLIDRLVSVSPADASGHEKLQRHKHTFTCYKKKNSSTCRFEAPFMPSRSTIILQPMTKTDSRRVPYSTIYKRIWKALEDNDYLDLDEFLRANKITSYAMYLDILRAGITRPRVFLKRETTEKWINPFNPFILNVLGSNMDFQFIIEEYSCAAYVVEYVNKTNRGISNLQRKIIDTMNEHPEFDIIEIARKLSVDMLNCVELTSQEAAWYLLRQSMSKSSVKVVYIPTSWPVERERVRKSNKELEEENVEQDSCDIWLDNCFDKYQKRPQELEDITLAQAVAYYTVSKANDWKRRPSSRVLRYRNYDMAADPNEHKREMVTLHLPFRNEENEILAERKYVQLYDDNDLLILERRQEFESNLDIAKTMQICRELRVEEENEDEEVTNDINLLAAHIRDTDPFADFLANANADANADLRLATLNRLGPVAKKRDNIMEKKDFNRLMRSANYRQKGLLLHVISHLLKNETQEPLQIFLTGPAGCGKTFVINLLREIYNRFSHTDGYCNAYLTCASTGKAAVAIDGTTIHTALKITIGRSQPLSFEVAQQYRSLFKYIQSILIDEVSMISAELNEKIDSRLKQIAAIDSPYGGKDIFLIGDLRQLPAVRATPIYKQTKNSMAGPTLWRGLRFYELNEVVRQVDVQFSRLLTKIGNGEILDETELGLIESRFFTKEDANEQCPNGVRLFFRNHDVDDYNKRILDAIPEKVSSIAKDVFIGYRSAEQLAHIRQQLHKKVVLDTGGLPYELTLVIGRPYMISTNIDVSDGLANGAIGCLEFIEYCDNSQPEDNPDDIDGTLGNDTVKRLWLRFPGNSKIGQKTIRISARYAQRNNMAKDLVPIERKNSTIYLDRNRTVSAKRNHFPLIPASGMTIHKSQGGTFDQVVYAYEKTHDQQLVYVALSRVTSLGGLFIVAPSNNHVFYHGRRIARSLLRLQDEFARLAKNPLRTCQDLILEFIRAKQSASFLIFNCQSLRAHNNDLTDAVTQECTFLMLSETWLRNDEPICVPNFDCCVQFKREGERAGGVAIYQKRNSAHITTPHMVLEYRQTSGYTVMSRAIGDVCAAECLLPNGQKILSVVVYISPNQRVNEIIKFLHFVLLPYTPVGSAELGDEYDTMPMIIGGDFNINFSSDEAEPLISFLREKLNLRMNTNRNIPTTNSNTTIDAVFSRYLETLQSQLFVSYFSYHKPIISCIKEIEQ